MNRTIIIFVGIIFKLNAMAQVNINIIYDIKGNMTAVSYTGNNPCPKSYLREEESKTSLFVEEKNFNLKAYPNPTNGLVKIEYSVSDETKLDIKLLNAQGITILNLLQHQDTQSGDYQKEINLKEYSPGIYFLQVNANNKVYTTRVLKTE